MTGQRNSNRLPGRHHFTVEVNGTDSFYRFRYRDRNHHHNRLLSPMSVTGQRKRNRNS